MAFLEISFSILGLSTPNLPISFAYKLCLYPKRTIIPISLSK